MNWSDLVYALALERSGTLSAAARELRVDHATVSRRATRLAESIGVKLFNKTPHGYRATAAGQVVLSAAREIQGRLIDMQMELQQHAAPASGAVRITAVETFFSSVLGPGLTALRDRYPDIELTLDPGATHRDLARGEAEIAVRSPRPTQPNLICRRAYTVECALHASQGYIERFGLPRTPLGDLTGHFVVRYAAELGWVPEEQWIDANLRGHRSPARACSMAQAYDLVHHSVGLGFVECPAGDQAPGLVRIPGSPTTHYTYWLVVHEEAYKAPRVRAVLEALAERCRDYEAGKR